MWAVFVLHLGWVLWQGWPTITRVCTSLGIGVVALAWERHLRGRALWLTKDEVVIANSSETHVVPKAGAGAALVEIDKFPYHRKIDSTDTSTSVKRLYIIPGDRSRKRIQVEAAEGISPRRMRAVVDELEMAFSEVG